MRRIATASLLLGLLASVSISRAAEGGGAPPAPTKQTEAEAATKSAGCRSCHTTSDSLTMHTSPGVTLGKLWRKGIPYHSSDRILSPLYREPILCRKGLQKSGLSWGDTAVLLWVKKATLRWIDEPAGNRRRHVVPVHPAVHVVEPGGCGSICK